MKLSEIKNKYTSGEYSRLKTIRVLRKEELQLNEIYSSELSLKMKIYLFLNEQPESMARCHVTQKVKAFHNIEQGFRQYCGNMDVCECNKNATSTRYANMSDDERMVVTEKRKNTTREKYGVDVVSQLEEIKQRAAATCIERYGVKSPTQNKSVLQKSVNTCLKNYGVEYPQQNQNIFEKTTNVFVSKYGVNRPAQSDFVKEKTKTAMILRYGVDTPFKDPEFAARAKQGMRLSKLSEVIEQRQNLHPLFTPDDYAHGNGETLFLWKCKQCSNEFFSTVRESKYSCQTCHPSSRTWGENLIENWLKEANVNYEFGSYKLITPHQVDFYIPERKVAIEFNGIYWHSELAGRGRTYHSDKYKKCKDIGVKLIQVFEHELLYKEDIIKSRIMNAIGKSEHKIQARKCKVIKVDWQTAKTFYEDNHLQGALTSKLNYALTFNDKVVSVMSFTKSRFSKKLAEWELTRFASEKNTTVIGAASKLFAKFVKDINPASVVSYADLRWGSGKTYEVLGFNFHHQSDANYWYFKDVNEVRSRVAFQKHKLPQEFHHLGSEWDIMQHLGWNRFWDCGNAVWIWKNTQSSK